MRSFATLFDVKHLWSFALAACLFACSSDANPTVGVGGGGVSGTGTRNVVVTDGPVGVATDGGSRPPIGVGTGNLDATPSDAEGQGTGGATGGDAMAASCDLVAQNCDSQQACYRDLSGGTSCEMPGFAAEVTTCAADTTCMKGMVCVAGDSGIAGCLPICDPQRLPCPDRRLCRPLRGHEPAGYCEL